MKKVLLLLFVLGAGNALHPLSAQECRPSDRTLQRSETDSVEAVRFIKDFYASCVFGTTDCEPLLKKSCTARLLKKLSDNYGYDGEGYAVWLFRTDAQDGPSDVSEVTAVAALGDGLYEVNFIDRGIAGRRILKIADENGVLKIDAVK